MAHAQIIVDQVLHGYQNGHSLLEASRKISPESERTMLTMSDMSGPTMVPGFEMYITGYPLPDLRCYALARTWLATDMERPGSVWTHTLLFRESDLHEIRRTDTLTKLFRRPSKSVSFEIYAERLYIDAEQIPSHYMNSSPPFAFENIFHALYEHADKPIYVLAENGTEFEDVLLTIWNTQWTKLRMNFSFCSGSIADRKLRNRSLDLQVVPRRNFSLLRQELSQGKILDDARLTSSNNPTIDISWTDAISSQERYRLEAFAEEIESDIPPRREVFVPVLKAYKCLRDVQSVSSSTPEVAEALVEEFSRVFPTADDGASLKSALLKSPLHLSHLGLQVFEYELLHSLCLAMKPEAFNPQRLEIGSRAGRLWRSDHAPALKLTDELIGNPRLNPIGEAFLEGVCDAIAPEDLAGLSANRQLVAETFVRRRPELATDPVIWQCRPNLQREMFQALIRSQADHAILERAIDAIIVSNASAAVNEFETAGQRILKPLLSWFNKNQFPKDRGLTEPIKRFLRDHAEETLEWLQKAHSSNALGVVSQSLEPDSSHVLGIPTQFWLSIAGEPGPQSAPRDPIMCAFLLAIGLRKEDSQAPQLVVYSFQPVHDAAAAETLPFESWRSFEDLAPPISMWRAWDHCERLRAALLDTFMSREWPTTLLLKSITNPETFRGLLMLGDTAKPRRRYLKNIASQVAQGVINASPEQLAVLQDFY